VLSSCSQKTASGVEVDSGLRGYILPKCKVLAGVDLDKLKQTDFYRRHQSQLELPQLNEIPREIGIDPRRDLSSFMFAWNGIDALAMTRGSFDPATLEKRLSTATRHEKYNKLTLYGDGRRDIVVLPKGVILAGPPALLKGVIADDKTGGGGVPEDLKLQLARVAKGSQAWLVSSGVISAGKLALRSDSTSMFSNISDYINASAIGVTLGSGAALDGHISCISEEGSQRVHDALRGIIGLARLSTKDNQIDQLRIWDAIQVEKQGKDVRIAAALTPELADKLVALLPSAANRF
jgi:hypothetical protein